MSLRRLFDIRQWRSSRRHTLEEIDEEFRALVHGSGK